MKEFPSRVLKKRQEKKEKQMPIKIRLRDIKRAIILIAIGAENRRDGDLRLISY